MMPESINTELFQVLSLTSICVYYTMKRIHGLTFLNPESLWFILNKVYYITII